jgi:hypothetical protein
VAVADGRTLDSVATGGFLGLWIGVYGTSNGQPTSTTAHVQRVEYLLPGTTTQQHHDAADPAAAAGGPRPAPPSEESP